MDKKELKELLRKEVVPYLVGLRNEIADKPKDFLEENEIKGVIFKGDKGDDGVTPIKDKDYPSEETVFNFIKDNLPLRGKDYFTEKDIKDIVSDVFALMPSKEDLKGKDGDNGVVDYSIFKELVTPLINGKLKSIKKEVDSTFQNVYEAIKAVESKTINLKDIIPYLESKTGSQRLDAKAIKGLEKYVTTFISTSTGGGGGGAPVDLSAYVPYTGATQITPTLGTVGLPTYSFVGDTNTGTYSPLADTLAQVAGGTEVNRINTFGQVINTGDNLQGMASYALVTGITRNSITANTFTFTGDSRAILKTGDYIQISFFGVDTFTVISNTVFSGNTTYTTAININNFFLGINNAQFFLHDGSSQVNTVRKLAINTRAVASGNDSVAIGHATAGGNGSFAMGLNVLDSFAGKVIAGGFSAFRSLTFHIPNSFSAGDTAMVFNGVDLTATYRTDARVNVNTPNGFQTNLRIISSVFSGGNTTVTFNTTLNATFYGAVNFKLYLVIGAGVSSRNISIGQDIQNFGSDSMAFGRFIRNSFTGVYQIGDFDNYETIENDVILISNNGVAGRIDIYIKKNVGIAIGHTNPQSKFHIISGIGEQFRSGFDANNYWNATTNSFGLTTFDAIGANAGFVFSKNVGFGITPTATVHLKAGTATAGTAPVKFTTGAFLTVPEVGTVEYSSTFQLTNSDGIRRHVVTAPNLTKVTAGAPYTNDGYVTINIGGTNFRVMTTA